ncbi:MAG: urate hydroxylase PuuD, partial [Elusimicrobia bacterium]|nr:urate hydroxylase PuuD [Elusimicrobiota bacterium]
MQNAQFFFRWFHVIAGITWIGFLFFFNFVNVPLQAELDEAAKKAVNPKLLPRALWWFRWGAMATLLSGLILYAMIFMYDPATGGLSAVGARMPSAWLMMGMLLGAVMWFNVWFIIWPTNRAILRGEMPAERQPAARRKAYLASRANTYMAGPMLFGMLGAEHASANGAGALAVGIVVGLLGILV